MEENHILANINFVVFLGDEMTCKQSVLFALKQQTNKVVLAVFAQRNSYVAMYLLIICSDMFNDGLN